MKTIQKPAIFQLEPTSFCNLKCTMCPHPMIEEHRQKSMMPFDFFQVIIDRDALPQTAKMGMHILGESLLHRDIIDMIEYASRKGIEIELATNGTILTPRISQALIDSGLKKLWFSFDGGTKEVYESIRIGAKFENVVRNIKTFLELNQGRVYTIVQLVGQRKNANDIENFKELWYDSGANEVGVKFLDTWAGTINLEEVQSPVIERFPCAEPFNRVAVLSNGDVVPCCRDWGAFYVYGNLREKPLLEIWKDEMAESLRKEHLEGNYVSEPCKSCNEWHIPMNRDDRSDPDKSRQVVSQF